MATGWVKSLQCKSRAFEDVHHPNPRNLTLLPNSGCTKSVNSLKDVIQNSKPQKRYRRPEAGVSPRPRPVSGQKPSGKPRTRSGSLVKDPFFPTLTELPEGHSSRNVVEIIFRTSWSEKGAFPGRVEMMFKVHNPDRTVARFEEYREAVKSRADGRCAADGNEVMRFHCVGPALAGAGGVWDAGGLCRFSGKEAGIRTFGGSGEAHESMGGGGGGKGRRAMLVCRVVAGRVCKGVESFLRGGVMGRFDSVSGENESLIVFDSRALLPCFLIIYKL